MRRTTCTAILCSLVLAAAAAAQRSPCFATVLGPDGKPIAGAAVTWVFTPNLVNPWPADVVTSTSDARGRARGELVVGRLYTAWAIGPADAGGVRLVSEPMPLVAAGRVFDLRALDRRPPRRVQLAGLGPWRAIGAVGLRWYPAASEDVHEDLPLPDPLPNGDTVLLPPSPWTSGCLGVRDARGEILVTAAVDAETTTLDEFAPPIEVVAKVTDTQGNALAGTRIEHQVLRRSGPSAMFRSGLGPQPWRRHAGATGADGELRFHAPKPAASTVGGKPRAGTLTVFASKQGFLLDPQAVGDAGPVSFRLRSSAPTTVRLQGADVPTMLVAAQGSYRLRTNSGGMAVSQYLLDVERREATPHVVHGGSGGFLLRLTLPGPMPTAFVTDHVQNPPDDLTIDLAKVTAIDVRVSGTEGGPAAAALAVTRGSEGFPVHWDALLATDVAGRAALRLPPLQTPAPPATGVYVYATTGTAHALALVDTAAREPLALQLEPVPTMRVRVVDAEGAPVSGARAVAAGSLFDSPSRDPLQKQWSRLAMDLWSSYAAMARSGADGVLLVPAFVRPGLTASARVRSAARASKPFDLQPGGDAEVTVRE